MARYAAVIQYLGGGYSGWQIQKNRPTIQGELKKAIARVAGVDCHWHGAGRTDAGVHAKGQVAHLDLSGDRDPQRLLNALNGVLAPDIRLIALRRADDGFHARKDAVGKRYCYRIFNGAVLSPFERGRVLHVRRLLDLDRMAEAASLLRGTWNFGGFASASTSVKTMVRTLAQSRISRRGRQLTYVVEGNGFLQYMVRNIVGTLLEVGSGLRPPEDMLRILASRDRRNAGATARPDGLYLMKVFYRRSQE